PGLCGVCEVTEVLRCYCGNEMKPIRCCDKEEPKESLVEDDGEVDQWDGYYSCGKECERFVFLDICTVSLLTSLTEHMTVASTIARSPAILKKQNLPIVR